MKTSFTLFPLIAFAALTARAADKPLLAVPGKLLYENTFASGADRAWHAAKGAWDSADSALRGAEKPEDNHGAVTRTQLKMQDFIIEYEVKLEGAKTTSLSINDAKEHVARIIIAPTMVAVQKDDHDHDGPDKAVVFARMPAKISPGTWHKVRMELVGDTMLGKVDDLVAFGSNDLFKTEKANFGFTVSGQTASFRNLKVWDATKNPEWDSVKSSLPKPATITAQPPAKGGAKGKK